MEPPKNVLVQNVSLRYFSTFKKKVYIVLHELSPADSIFVFPVLDFFPFDVSTCIHTVCCIILSRLRILSLRECSSIFYLFFFCHTNHFIHDLFSVFLKFFFDFSNDQLSFISVYYYDRPRQQPKLLLDHYRLRTTSDQI